MCLKHSGFRSVLTTSKFDNISAVIVDEAHCIAAWGGEFRMAYSKLAKLRTFFPPHIPILTTSSTLTPPALREVCTSLMIDLDDSFFLNLGNDCPNISYSIHKINSSEDYNALKPHLTHHANPSTPDDFIKSVIFMNTVVPTHVLVQEVRSWFPCHLRDCIDFLHAHHSPHAKKRALQRFRNGQTRILIVTESAGMVSHTFSSVSF